MKIIIRLLKMARKYYPTLFITIFALLGAAALNLSTPFLVQRLTGSLTGRQRNSNIYSDLRMHLAVSASAACRLPFSCNVAGARNRMEFCGGADTESL